MPANEYWQVFTWKGIWRLHSTYTSLEEAQEYVEYLTWKGKKAKVVKKKPKVVET